MLGHPTARDDELLQRLQQVQAERDAVVTANDQLGSALATLRRSISVMSSATTSIVPETSAKDRFLRFVDEVRETKPHHSEADELRQLLAAANAASESEANATLLNVQLLQASNRQLTADAVSAAARERVSRAEQQAATSQLRVQHSAPAQDATFDALFGGDEGGHEWQLVVDDLRRNVTRLEGEAASKADEFSATQLANTALVEDLLIDKAAMEQAAADANQQINALERQAERMSCAMGELQSSPPQSSATGRRTESDDDREEHLAVVEQQLAVAHDQLATERELRLLGEERNHDLEQQCRASHDDVLRARDAMSVMELQLEEAHGAAHDTRSLQMRVAAHGDETVRLKDELHKARADEAKLQASAKRQQRAACLTATNATRTMQLGIFAECFLIPRAKVMLRQLAAAGDALAREQLAVQRLEEGTALATVALKEAEQLRADDAVQARIELRLASEQGKQLAATLRMFKAQQSTPSPPAATPPTGLSEVDDDDLLRTPPRYADAFTPPPEVSGRSDSNVPEPVPTPQRPIATSTATLAGRKTSSWLGKMKAKVVKGKADAAEAQQLEVNNAQSAMHAVLLENIALQQEVDLLRRRLHIDDL
jgi:hypothetical protein